MVNVPRFRFLAIAVVFHVLYFFSIFDIYFVSPIVSGMTLYGVERPEDSKAPADRLVLFVGDGLRADKAFQSHYPPYPKPLEEPTSRHLAPFLRSRCLEHGTFGVSHTRVPTESRPGHVALIAGLYEDVSAVTTGWKLNPVHFDSVFNRSRHTWSWGSPDILAMFEHGAVPGRVDAYMYGAAEEDFSQDATALDLWVFDHVEEFFAEAERNQTMNNYLRQDKLVFFLHLLGLDTTGHAYRPYSPEYLHNLEIVDEGVEKITDLINDFYNDNRTAFIFTADHGMSDWGSHGDGHPDNTRTPLIAWGSGVAKPRLSEPHTIAPGHDEFSSDWDLNQVQRNDVNQADIAALMAYLAGLEYPANSVGVLPLAYLAADIEEKANAALVNAKGILEMYRVKEELKKDHELKYRPYRPFEILSSQKRVDEIAQLITEGRHEKAIEESAKLIKLALEGMRYLQTYDWLFLRILITTGYLGWIAFALTIVVNHHVLHGRVDAQRTFGPLLFFSSGLVTLYASFYSAHSPVMYYAYAFFPVMFWEEVFARRRCLQEGGKVLFQHTKTAPEVLQLIFNVVVYVGVLVALAMGYIYREILTGFYVVGAFWPLTQGISFIREHVVLCITWFMTCLVMSSFTLLPAMKKEDVSLIMAGGCLMTIWGLLYLIFEDYILANFSFARAKAATSNAATRLKSRTITGIQIGLVILSIITTRSSALSLQAKQGLPRGNQVVGWTVMVLSFLMPVAYRLQPNNSYLHRLMTIFLTCAPSFVILTISYEGLFYVVFSIQLFIWVLLEHQAYVLSLKRANHSESPQIVDQRLLLDDLGDSSSTISTEIGPGNTKALDTASASSIASSSSIPPPIGRLQPLIGNTHGGSDTVSYRPLTLSDARTALFFIILLQSAFFSTGNVASVSSFSLDSVYRLIPIFEPFSQGALLIVKLMIPFVLISANLGILNKKLGVPPSALFMVVMAVSDILTLYFFWVVKDEGSWLEIGSTISHFAIASLLCVFVAGLEGVSAIFIAGVEVNSSDINHEPELKCSAALIKEDLTT